MPTRIEITISADGQQTSMHVIGVQGPSCLKATAALEEALGIVTERIKTSDFHAKATQTTENKEKAVY